MKEQMHQLADDILQVWLDDGQVSRSYCEALEVAYKVLTNKNYDGLQAIYG